MKKRAILLFLPVLAALVLSAGLLPAAAEDPPPEEKTPVSLSIVSGPDKTVYRAGETFDAAGLRLSVTYSDQSEEEVALSGVSGLPGRLDAEALGGKAGEAVFPLSFTAEGATVSADLSISVRDELLSVVFTAVPTAVLNDNAVDFSGVRAVATYAIEGEKVFSEGVSIGPYDNTIFNPDLKNGFFEAEATFTDAGGLSASAPVRVPVVSDVPVPADRVLYVSSTGSGDGSSPLSPLGRDANYPSGLWVDLQGALGEPGLLYDENFAPVPSCVYQGSELYRAIYALSPAGGRIVIVGEASFGPGGDEISDGFIALGAAGNVDLPFWEGKIEITGFDMDSIFSLDARLNAPRLHFNGPLSVYDVIFSVDFTSISTGRPLIAFGGCDALLDLTDGEGGARAILREFTLEDGVLSASSVTRAPGGESRLDPDVCLSAVKGDLSARNGSATLSLTGGRYHNVYAGGCDPLPGGYTISGDLTLSLTGVAVSGETGASPSDENGEYAAFDGNVTVVVNDGCSFGGHIGFSKRRFVSDGYVFRLAVNAMPSLSPDNGYGTKLFRASAGGSVSGSKGLCVLDFSGMDFSTFASLRFAADLTFFRHDASCVYPDGSPAGRGVSSSAGFHKVLVPCGVTYVGASIRLTGNMGIRFKFELRDELKAPGFRFGVLIGRAGNFVSDPMTTGHEKAVDRVLYDFESGVDRYFVKEEGRTVYTIVITDSAGNWGDEERKTDYMVMPYTVENGVTRYGSFLGFSLSSGGVNRKNTGAGLVRSVRYVASLMVPFYAGTPFEETVASLAAA